MARTEYMACPRIVMNGGPITSDVVKSYYSSGATSEDWIAGSLLQLTASGLVTLPVAVGNDIGAATNVRYIALKANDSSANEKSIFVAVQAITEDTVFEGQLCDTGSGSSIPAQAMIGDRLDVWLHTTGVWAPDINDTTNPVVEIVDVETNFDPYSTEKGNVYGLVRFKFLESVIEKAAA